MNEFYAWLWRMNRKGKTLDDLSEMTGLSRDKIGRHIQSHRWERGEVVMSAKQLTQAYVVEGKTIHQIAEQMLCTDEAVRKHMIKYNIQRRRPGNPTYKRNNGDCEEQRNLSNTGEIKSDTNDIICMK